METIRVNKHRRAHSRAKHTSYKSVWLIIAKCVVVDEEYFYHWHVHEKMMIWLMILDETTIPWQIKWMQGIEKSVFCCWWRLKQLLLTHPVKLSVLFHARTEIRWEIVRISTLFAGKLVQTQGNCPYHSRSFGLWFLCIASLLWFVQLFIW